MPKKQSLSFDRNSVDHVQYALFPYARGKNKVDDWVMQDWNEHRCTLCEKPDRTKRCGGCPVRLMKKIVLYIPPFLSRPSDGSEDCS